MNNQINTDLIINYLFLNKLTKSEFCKMCKISYGTLEKVMSKNQNFNISALFKIAKVLNVKIHEIFS